MTHRRPFRQDFLGAATDLEGLYAYDSDGDGFLTSADERFSEFRVWRYVNGNGHSEKNELFTLFDLGVVRIGLERTSIAPLDRDADRNQIVGMSVFETGDGNRHLLGDAALFAHVSTHAQVELISYDERPHFATISEFGG